MDRIGNKELIEHALLDLIFPSPVPVHCGVRVKRKRPPRGKNRMQHMHTEPSETGDGTALPHAEIVERLSTRTMAVRWSDSQSGCYGEQLWRMGLSRCHSRCAVTGLPICPGDTVFRPVTYEWRVPFNQNRMILASAVGAADFIRSTT
jgi:hypothetical protein